MILRGRIHQVVILQQNGFTLIKLVAILAWPVFHMLLLSELLTLEISVPITCILFELLSIRVVQSPKLCPIVLRLHIWRTT